MRSSALLLLLPFGLAACAGGAATGTRTEPTRVLTTSARGDAEIVLGSELIVESTAVPAPPDRAFEALLRAYEELNIPLTLLEPEGRALANEGWRPPRRLADRRLSDLVDCGTSNLGVALADQYRVTLSIRSSVVPAGDESAVHTVIEGWARNPDGASRDPVRCASTGLLEEEIGRRVLLRASTAG